MKKFIIDVGVNGYLYIFKINPKIKFETPVKTTALYVENDSDIMPIQFESIFKILIYNQIDKLENFSEIVFKQVLTKKVLYRKKIQDM